MIQVPALQGEVKLLAFWPQQSESNAERRPHNSVALAGDFADAGRYRPSGLPSDFQRE